MKKFEKYLFLAGDLFVLNLSMIIGLYIRFGYSRKFFREEYILFYLLSNFVWITLFLIFNQSLENRRINTSGIFKIFLKKWVVYLFLILSIITIIKGHFYSRLFIIYNFASFLVIGSFLRIVIKKILNFNKIKGNNIKRIVVIGINDFSKSFVKELKLHPEYGYEFKGFFYLNKNEKYKIDNAYHFDEIYDFLKDQRINEIYIANGDDMSGSDSLIKFCEYNNIQLKFINPFAHKLYKKNIHLKPNYNGLTPIFEVENKKIEYQAFFIAKRAFDILFSSLFLLTIGWWLFPIIALLIKSESKGPVFFLQERSGLNNKPFNIIKFRTMVINDNADTKQAVQNDSRITKTGKFLRTSNIDELPQIFNILLGDMSFVGPRPHMLAHTTYYSSKISNYEERLWLRPGITGLAQAKGYIGETKHISLMEGRVMYDRQYVHNYRFVLDIKIIIITAFNILLNK